MNRFQRSLIAVLVLAIVVLLAGGYWFYSAQNKFLRKEAEKELETIASLKVEQIANWRATQLMYAEALAENHLLTAGPTKWLLDSNDEHMAQFFTLFRSLAADFRFRDVVVADVNGQARVSLKGRHGPLNAEVLEAVLSALRGNGPTLTEVSIGPGDLSPHLDLIVPLFGPGEEEPEPIGAIILQIDLQLFLYPLLQKWPTPSSTSETLLVQRMGEEALVLNDLRFQKNAASNFRIPLSRTDLPMVMAVQGKEGLVQGKDYRGVEVIAFLKAVPDSPWFLVSKIDKAEAYSTVRRESIRILALIGLLMAAMLAAVAAIWQAYAKSHYQALYQAQAETRESEERYRILVENAGEAIFVGQDGALKFANERLEQITGYSREELASRPLESFYHPEDRALVLERRRKRMEGIEVPSTYSFRIIHRSGEVRWVELNVVVIDWEGTYATLNFMRDITERKQAEEILRENGERFDTLLGSLNDGVWAATADWTRMSVPKPGDGTYLRTQRGRNAGEPGFLDEDRASRGPGYIGRLDPRTF